MKKYLLFLLASFWLGYAADAAITNDIEYGVAGGESLKLDAAVPEGAGPFPAVIIVHGGGWTGGDKQQNVPVFYEGLTKAGYAWFSINYRLAPKHPWPACSDDVDTAIRWVKAHAREYRVDASRIALAGPSAGGHLVSLAGARRRPGAEVQAVAAFFGVHDMMDYATRPEMLQRVFGFSELNDAARATLKEASPVNFIRADLPPYLLFHGTKDTAVPYEQSVNFQAKMLAAGARCEFVTLPGEGHGLLRKDRPAPDYPGQLVAWLDRVLKPLKPAAAAIQPRYGIDERQTPEGVRLILLHDAVAGLEAAVAPERGAELAGLRVDFRGQSVELIHRARDYAASAGWQGRAPILWPAVGRNFAAGVPASLDSPTGSYDWHEQRYEIPLHGFARLRPWRVVVTEHTTDFARIELELVDDRETRAQYPFGFVHRLCYTVRAGALIIEHRITASRDNADPMFFSIGNHLTLRVPLVAGSRLADCTLASLSRWEYLKDPQTRPTGATQARSFVTAVSLAGLEVSSAVGLGGYEGDPWMRIADPAGLAVRVSHHADRLPDGPLIGFNLWGAPASGYLCPEPWVGLNNSFNLRQGLIELSPGESWSWRVRVEPEISGPRTV